MTLEEARAYFIASTVTSALLAAAALGCVRLWAGVFGTLTDDVDGPITYIMDQVAGFIVWLLLFCIGMVVCTAPVHAKDVPEHAIDDFFLVVCILGQAFVYFLGTAAVLVYRHFVMYHGVHRRLERAKVWRDASRRIDRAIGSSTHVKEIEDAYNRLYDMVSLLGTDYSPYRFKVGNWRFTAGMAALRVSSAIVVALMANMVAGGAT